MKNSLNKKGLSMSEAASISNICNQKALDIVGKLSSINNYSRTVKVEGVDHLLTQGNELPKNIVTLILEKAKYHGAQAFLMENIKAKDNLLKDLKNKQFIYTVDAPESTPYEQAKLLPEVGEAWAREQLTLDEVNEYLAQETIAAHVGQFIHKKSVLETLRNELPTLETLEWMEVEAGKKTPVVIKSHHTQEQLSKLHEEFSALHREAEQKVNFIKAQIKNLITKENARIAEVNAAELTRVNNLNTSIREVNSASATKWREEYRVAQAEFESQRNKDISEAASLKIKTAPQFQDIVNEILELLAKK